MHAFTHFSNHAYKRIKQRSQLSFNEIKVILDGKFYVNRGTEPGFNRDHIVFYSHKDECCFVAIRDNLTGEVVTILPLTYHKNLAWKISDEDISRAIKIYPNHLLIDKETEKGGEHEETRKFYVAIHFIDTFEKRRSTPVVAIQSKRKWNEANLFIHDENLIQVVKDKISLLSLSTHSVLGITIKSGKRGSPNFFTLQDIETYSNQTNDTD